MHEQVKRCIGKVNSSILGIGIEVSDQTRTEWLELFVCYKVNEPIKRVEVTEKSHHG